MNQNIQKWLKSNSAQKYLQKEAESLRKISHNICGHVGLQLTLSDQVDLLKGLNFSEKYHVATDLNHNGSVVSLDAYTSVEELPFESNLFSIVAAPRLSLFTEDIHAAMREIYRVTAPEGLILISGMNPASLVGLQAKIYSKRYPLTPMVGLSEMKSWLSLLGCEIKAGDLFHYHYLRDKPLTDASLVADKIEKIGNRWLPMFSGGYSLLAKKSVFSGVLNTNKREKRKKNAKMVNSVAKKY